MRIVIKISRRFNVTRCVIVKRITANTTLAIIGLISGASEKLISFFTITTTIITDVAISALEIAKPLYPNIIIAIGVIIQVAIVHPIIKYNVIFIFPIALIAFVKGVEIEDSAAFNAKNPRDKIAGSHF